MFTLATAFNGDVSAWNTAAVKTMVSSEGIIIVHVPFVVHSNILMRCWRLISFLCFPCLAWHVQWCNEFQQECVKLGHLKLYWYGKSKEHYDRMRLRSSSNPKRVLWHMFDVTLNIPFVLPPSPTSSIKCLMVFNILMGVCLIGTPQPWLLW